MGRLKSIFPIRNSASKGPPNRPSGRRRECAVNSEPPSAAENCAGQIHFARALKYRRVEPPFGRRNPKRKDILSDVLSFWWRRGELNPRPKTHPRELLRAQAVIAGALRSLFPSRLASRHAIRSGESHDAWAGQLLPAARTPHQPRHPRPVATPVQTAALSRGENYVIVVL